MVPILVDVGLLLSGIFGTRHRKEGDTRDLKRVTEVSLRLKDIKNHKRTYILC